MESSNKNNPKELNVHKVLMHSYSVYLALFLVGVIMDVVFRIQIFMNPFLVLIGVVFLIFGSTLVLWAQHTSRRFNTEGLTKETFCRGPYCFTRSPTHFGLFFLVLGFGVIVNAFFVVLSTIISFFLGKFLFLTREEKILAIKYGAPYIEYKKSVKF